MEREAEDRSSMWRFGSEQEQECSSAWEWRCSDTLGDPLSPDGSMKQSGCMMKTSRECSTICYGQEATVWFCELIQEFLERVFQCRLFLIHEKLDEPTFFVVAAVREEEDYCSSRNFSDRLMQVRTKQRLNRSTQKSSRVVVNILWRSRM